MSTTVAENERRGVANERLDEVVIRFAGDSGDGMQLTGSQFTTTSALVGNDLSTLPDFPAEIRAPAGTLPGVSAFQVRIADYDIHTPGDAPDVLVAMNPAALKKELRDLKPNGIVIVNTDEFNDRSFARAGITTNPLEDGSLAGYRVFQVALTTMTRRTLEGSGLDTKTMDRSKNMFALGMCYWLFSRPLEPTVDYLTRYFAKKPQVAEANVKVLKAGWNFCDITELFHTRYEVPAAVMEPGLYRNIMGNSALALGLVAASRRSGLPLFLGAYPITPASDVLHELATYKTFGVTTFQAEDEIAAVCAAIGASFGGALGVTVSSGPGIALKAEAMNLAVMTELPLVVCNIQRGGPSTGLPTKTEQADLLQVMFGRNGESPVPVVAASSPKDCFADGARGGAHRHHLHGAGGAALGRLHRERLGALEAAGDRGPPRPAGRVPHQPRGLPPLLARPRDARPAVGDPGHAGARAPHRRHREGGRDRQRLLRPGEPRAHGAHARREGGQDRQRHPGARGPRRPVRRRPPGHRLGLDLGRDQRRRQRGPQARPLGVARAPALPEPVPEEPGRGARPVRPRALPRDEPRAARPPAAGPVPEGRRHLQQGPGPAVHPAGDPRQDPRRCWSRPMSTETQTRSFTKKDYQTDQEVRWCPGCGDYAILSSVQQVFPELGIPRERFVVVSGIGCSSRFPYYMNTFGFHSIHGRAPAVATGLKLARPDLEVWIATGDGDAMSIGGNHLIHTLRRNVGVKILMFNNRIYGLTKGQYSPTSELGKKTKSTPVGSVDYPFNPLSLAIGAGATFVARSVDIFQNHLRDTLRRAAAHQGTAYVEIYQNCNIFNDKAFTYMTDKDSREESTLYLEHGKPLVFGKNKDKGIRIVGTELEVIRFADGFGPDDCLVWDEVLTNPATAFLIAQLGPPDFPTPVGVMRSVEVPSFEERAVAQIQAEIARKGEGRLDDLLRSGDVWTVGPEPAPS